MTTPTATGAFAVDALLAEARSSTGGLDDFGDARFMPALHRLCDSLDREAKLSPTGVYLMRTKLISQLVNRLRLEDYFKQHPEIADEVIAAPVVIVGLPRTGTTKLHRLLSRDPRFHWMAWWESIYPVPFAGETLQQPSARIAQARSDVQAMTTAMPKLTAIHPMDADAADEEVMLMEHSFLSAFNAYADVPSYMQWMDAQDQRPAYAFLKRMLQFLQWQKRQRGITAERWVLKAPHHLLRMGVLLDEFPGARVIQTHRDPKSSIPSIASFIHTLWCIYSDNAAAHDADTRSARRRGVLRRALHRYRETTDGGREPGLRVPGPGSAAGHRRDDAPLAGRRREVTPGRPRLHRCAVWLVRRADRAGFRRVHRAASGLSTTPARQASHNETNEERCAMLLRDKVVVISGIGPGLGVKLAIEAAREGARGVICAARTADKLDDAEARIKALGVDTQVLKIVTDISDRSQCDRLVETTLKTFGRIDALVNSAFVHGDFDHASTANLDRWADVFNVNLLGTLKLTQAVLPGMQQRKSGAVVMINTMAARKVPSVPEAGYAASKGALATSVKFLANEVGKDNIRVNSIHMGWMWGAPVEGYMVMQAQQTGVPLDELKAQVSKDIPLGRIVTDDECARAALFLVSDYASAITGAALDCNGGMYMP